MCTCHLFGCYTGKYWTNMAGRYLRPFYVFRHLLISAYSWAGCISAQASPTGVPQSPLPSAAVVHTLRREQ